MGGEVIQGATFVAVLAMTVFLWRVFGARFDTFAADVKDRFDKVDREFDKVDREFAKVHEKFAKVDEKFDKVDERLGAVERRFDGLEGRFDGLEGRFDGLEGRFGSLERRVDGLATDHQRLSEQIAEFRGEMRARFPLPTVAEP